MRKVSLKRRPCVNEAAHTPSPTGYIAWTEWAEEMRKTHEQTRCEGCGLWLVWKEKTVEKAET